MKSKESFQSTMASRIYSSGLDSGFKVSVCVFTYSPGKRKVANLTCELFDATFDAAGTDVSPTMKCLSRAEFGNFLLAVPPLEEQAAIVRFLSVLIVACPCAFGIAEPLVLTAAIEKIRRLGIQIFNGSKVNRPE